MTNAHHNVNEAMRAEQLDCGIRFLNLRDDPNPELYIPKVVPWLYESGRHHFDMLFGGCERAQKRLEAWVWRPSSEFAIRRTTVALVRERCAGAFLALSGKDLMVCRKADTLALMKETESENRKSLIERLAVLRDLTPPVLPADCYLRSLSVDASVRGKGLGRKLFERFSQDGVEQGFRRFRLDVLADNAVAINLYSSFGFQIVHEAVVPQTGWRILSMVLEKGTR